ncbi:M28 family peptidase [Nocardioides sp.]|uniref:M28 family metallopeptidase n=1 Tax=Nocardioides sp. TaxID=35761 RepID=UPI0031FEE30A|nr:hypothetical protein [Nocardioides sp.]
MGAKHVLASAMGLAALVGCSADPQPEDGATPTSPASTSSPTSPAPTTPAATAPTTPGAPATFDTAAAMAHIRVLAGRIGPRLATGPAFREAARYVETQLRAQGYDVRRQPFPVPAGDSWGVPVDAGRSFNVVATPSGFDAGSPYRIVGAHLDTVAVAPGAEDNASGVAVLLELARLAATDGTQLPTVLIAFGAEEPRGTGDALHHFGSMAYVREMSKTERASLRAMVAMDRVGVGALVPVCLGRGGNPRLRDELLALARRADVAASICAGGYNESSDHWSFEKGGFDAARVGGTSYAGYHSASDVPSVVNRRQLDRTGRLIWAWLRAR